MGPTVLDERGAFAVENPEVAEVMEIASGDHLDHGEVIGTDYEKAIQLRMALRTDIKRGTPHYACSLCGVPVYLLLRPDEVLSGILDAPVLEVAHDALRVLLQHRHMGAGCVA